MIWIVVGSIFFIGVLTGLIIAALFVDAHIRDETERAYMLGHAEGERAAEKLIPFPHSSGPRAA